MGQTAPQPFALIAERVAHAGRDLHGVLARNGFQVAGPFASIAEVSSWIEQWTPAVAILDAVLNDGPIDELADVLRRRGVLVLVHDEVTGTSKRYEAMPDSRDRHEDSADLACESLIQIGNKS